MSPRILTNKVNVFCLIAVAACVALAPSPSRATCRQVHLDLSSQDYDEVRLSDVADFPLDRSWVDVYHAYLRYPEDPTNSVYQLPFVGAVDGILYSPSVCPEVAGVGGPIEIGIFLKGVPEVIGPREVPFPPILNLRIGRDAPGTGSNWPEIGYEPDWGEYSYQLSYREVFLMPSGSHRLPIQPKIALDGRLLLETLKELRRTHMLDEQMKEEAYAFIDVFNSLELVVAARRVDDYCTMNATVSGDINQHFFGDLAYFNTAVHPVKKGMMVGTIGETQTHEEVEGFGTVDVSRENALEMAAKFGFLSEDEAEQAIADDATAGDTEQLDEDEEPQGFAEWAQEELRADDPSEGDNFGLNLADLKSDQNAKTDEAATAMFAGAFTLALSGRADVEQGPLEEPRPRDASVRPSTITATVGLSDKGGDRIPFEMIEGSPPQFSFFNVNDEFIFGMLWGDLETKGVYTLEGVASSPRKLKITVVATFGARRGSLSCMQ